MNPRDDDDSNAGWTRIAPKRAGRYRCRFLPEPGIDREPFTVELLESRSCNSV